MLSAQSQSWRNWPPKAKLRMLEKLKARSAASSAFASKYFDNPAGFVTDCLEWRNDGPAVYQLEILQALPEHRRACVRGPHGLGKTALAAWAILWFALTRDGLDWKIPTTASAWRQLSKFLWPEVHKWARRVKWDVVGRAAFDAKIELQTMALKLSTGEAFALASNNSDLLEGAHAKHLLYVFDEAKAIPAATWDAAEGAFSTGDAYALAISTPGEPSCRFFDIQSRKAGYEDWWTRRVSLDEAITAGQISKAWQIARAAQWGEKSAVYVNRVLGDFASSDEDGIIPLSWVEDSNERHADILESGQIVEIDTIGIDVARSGDDKTVFALAGDGVLIKIEEHAKEDTMKTAGRAAALLMLHQKAIAIVDVIGVGAGVFDRLREQFSGRVVAFNAAEKTMLKDNAGVLGFTNKRAAGWWRFRELLDVSIGGCGALPQNDKLTGDLTAPKWFVNSSGKIQVESKDDVKQRIGRSTDYADAAIMALVGKGIVQQGVFLVGAKR